MLLFLAVKKVPKMQVLPLWLAVKLKHFHKLKLF